MSLPEHGPSEEWSTPRHYGTRNSAPPATHKPSDQDWSGDSRWQAGDQSLMPLPGPGDSSLLAVALASGSQDTWSAPSYHGPRRHRPRVVLFDHSAETQAGAPNPDASPETVQADESATQAGPGVMASSARMAVASLVSRLTGFLRTIALAAALGSGGVADAYNLANTLPNMVYEIMLGGVLTSVVIPILVKAQHDDADDGVGYTQRLLSILVSGLGVGTLIAVAAAPLLIDFFGGDSQSREVATLWATVLLPEIFFYGLGAVLSAVLNTRNVYGWPAWAPVLNNIITIVAVGVFVLIPGPANLTTATITNSQILVVGTGTTLGIAIQAIVLLLPLRRLGFSWQWRFRARPNEVGRMAEFRTLAVWVLGYVVISQIGVVAINKVARPRRGVTIFAYADLLFQVPYGVLGVSLLTALMPRMSRAAAMRDTDAVLADLRLGARLSAVALVPITAGLVVFGPAFTSVILLGKFTFSDARLTGIALAASAFGLLPFALVMLQQRVFYAMRDTRTPTLINVAMVGTKVALVIASTQVLSTRGVIIALTVSTSLSYVAGAVTGHFLLRRKFGLLGFGVVARTVGWIGLASVAAGLGGLAVILLSDAALGSGRATALVQLVAGCAVGVVILIAVATRLPLPEVAEIRNSVRARTGRAAA